MKSIRHTQIGWLMIIVFLPVILIFAYKIFRYSGTSNVPVYVFFGTQFITAVFLYIFYSLTIKVDDEYVMFWFGTGIVKKRYLLSEIKSCKPVKNKIYYGWGIRRLVHGWLYNVSGTKAIELTFKNSPKIIRIGTDMPEMISEYINIKLARE